LKQTAEKGLVQDFIDNPYFLRPKYLPSGRVTAETASEWKIEDDIESSKGSSQWRSVAERIARRKKEGRKRFKASWKVTEAPEEISDLTVDCDFQEVPLQLPGRIRNQSPDRGFHFVTEHKELIHGPKTQEETEEDERYKLGMIEYMKYRNEHRIVVPPAKTGVGRNNWSPRWEDTEIKATDQIPVSMFIHIDEVSDIFDWTLRRDLEWVDLRFLVNSRLGRNRWEASMAGVFWNGKDKTPMPGQRINIYSLGEGHGRNNAVDELEDALKKTRKLRGPKKFEKHLKAKQ
jgi:hypothetical protein